MCYDSFYYCIESEVSSAYLFVIEVYLPVACQWLSAIYTVHLCHQMSIFIFMRRRLFIQVVHVLYCNFQILSWIYERLSQMYSISHNSLIFCFAQLLLQIFINYQNQGQFWNLHILRIPKLSLKVKFDQDLAEKIEVQDNRSISKKCLRLDFVFVLDYLRQILVKSNFQGQFWNPQDVQIPKLSLVLIIDQDLQE